MNFRKAVTLLLTLLLCLSAVGCGALAGPDRGTDPGTSSSAVPYRDAPPESSEAVEDGLLRIGSTGAFGTMDVQKTTDSYLIPLNIYERLFDIRVNGDGSTQLAKGLAEDYSVSEDGLTYRFTLREDAYFSDGTPVLARDVAFTFTRMLALPESLQTDFADMILGAEAVMSGEADTPEGIRIVDRKNLEITLSEPFAGYIYQLATPSCSILSERFVTAVGAGFGSSPELTMGSGPFMVTEAAKNKITLELNPYYHCRDGEELSVKRAEILILDPALMDRTFREGGLDILDTNNINPDAA